MAHVIESEAETNGATGRHWLARLRDDTRGNVLIIVAAAIIPLVCLIGSGVDLSRAYAAQARLQVAGHAASLAGRRAMTGGAVDEAVKKEAKKFFNFNFPQRSFGTAAFNPDIKGGTNSAVVVTASTTIPTSIMKIFGFTSLPLSVTCDARQDFVNTDIMLILDTTGSMVDNKVDDGDPGTPNPTRIDALRKAVLALYDELKPVQTQLEAAGLQLRYGVVPYSSNVNVGKVVKGLNASYIASNTWDYQSRKQVGTKGNGKPDWSYEKVTLDVSKFVNSSASTPMATPSRDPSDTSDTSYWSGCIEERQTVSTISDSSGYSIPANAYDLDIDREPDGNEATKWKPFWPEVSYLRNGTRQKGRDGISAWVACPSEAKRLKAMSRADLKAYLDGLNTEGGTYHDIGMIWGTRMLSRKGIFKDDNPETHKSMPVSRFIIFLT
ncbi:MAG: pilus assembly protein, partial [Sphingomonadaceae bacterium]